MRYALAIIFASALIGCNRSNQEEMTRFHEDGRVKPTIAVASLLDTTSFDATWSLSEEITQGIMQQIAQTGDVFVHSQQESPFTENPFGPELSWMKREFHSEEFVAFLELVEHEFVPVKSKGLTEQESPSNLNMALRLRVVDLRGDFPKIVLQEMIRDSYFVPKSLIPCDYSIDAWGTAGFSRTPMGTAHIQLIKDVSARIRDYILLAKSR